MRRGDGRKELTTEGGAGQDQGIWAVAYKAARDLIKKDTAKRC
jgi:hypothetical protein